MQAAIDTDACAGGGRRATALRARAEIDPNPELHVRGRRDRRLLCQLHVRPRPRRGDDGGHPLGQARPEDRQPIGRLKGTGGGPSLMLNGHMDPGVRDERLERRSLRRQVRGRLGVGDGRARRQGRRGGGHLRGGGHRPLRHAPARRRLVTPVVAHKLGGAGTRALMAKGLRADLGINMEHSANTIANVCVGIVMVRIKTQERPSCSSATARRRAAQYMNPIEQQAEIVRRIGPSLDSDPARRLAALHAAPGTAGVPDAHLRHDAQGALLPEELHGHSSRGCEMVFQFRTVPGQT